MREDQLQRRRNALGKDEQHDQRAQHVADAHGRYQQLGHRADTADAAEHDEAGQDDEDHARHPFRRTEGVVDRAGDAVGLNHVTDAKTSQSTEHGEGGRHPAPVFAKAIPDCVHRATGQFAFGVELAIFDRQHDFAIFGGHADQRGHPHPEQRARPADRDGGRHPGNIAGSHRRRQTGHQRRKRGNLAGRIAVAHTAFHDHAEAMANLEDRHETQTDLQEQAGTKNQHDHRYAPDDRVDRVHQLGQILHHRFSPKITPQ